MNLQQRLTGLLTQPRKEWTIIAAEPAEIASLYRQFIVVVAAVPPVALLLRFTIGGSPVYGLSVGLRRYLVALASPIIAALVVEKLAPRFKSHGSTADALKLVAYSFAAVWVAGAFNLIPLLGGFATLVGVLYAGYLFSLGLPRVLHTPREQVVPFLVVCAILLLVVNIVLNGLLVN